MKKNSIYLLFIIIGCLFTVIQTLSSCANIIPPGGGPKDTIPPVLVSALPRDTSTNIDVKTKQFILTFDEYVEVKDAQTNLIVSPVPKNLPVVDYKLKNVIIKLKDSLEHNMTYSFDFGNSVRDVNEGNVAKNFSYVFSTGKTIDHNGFSGKVILAETGKTDSTLIVVLHKNLHDSSIVKNRGRYYARVDGKGNFAFSNLPEGKFAVYVLPNDYTKKYDDSTKLFAFSDSLITTGRSTRPVTLYAYEEVKRKTVEKPSPANNNATPAAPAKKSNKESKEDKRLRITTNLENGKQDVLNPFLQLTFTRKLQSLDTTKLLLTDSNYHQLKDYQIDLDSTRTKVQIRYHWPLDTHFRLLLAKDVVVDTTGTMLSKGDTLKFATKGEEDYGSIELRFTNLDLSKNPVLQLVQNDKIMESIPVTQRVLTRKLYKPGEYELRVLFDRNKNGIWDTGNFKKKLQPEIVEFINKKLTVKANWDNEADVPL
jgi:hypothetical protein